MLALKLQRIGRKHQPSYRIVVAEKRSKLNGEPVEDLGSYQPGSKTLAVNADRVKYWLGVGVQPTVTAHNLLVKNGLVAGAKRVVKMPAAVAPAPEPEPVTKPAAVEEAAEAPAEAATEEVAADAVAEEPPAEPAVE